MPRVSEVLDYFAEPYLVAWKLKNKDWQKVSDESLRVGTIVDELVQADINGVMAVDGSGFNDQIRNCVTAWVKFKSAHTDVYTKLIKYKANMQRELVLGDLVGHPDFILDDEVIDLKTSKQISKSHWMQTAQYAHMVMSQTILVHAKGIRFPEKMVPGAVIEAYSTEDLTIFKQEIKKISILRLDKATGEYEYKTLEEPFITFWQRKFQARYEAFCEDKEFSEMMRVKLEEEKL